jgi:hypothetical protein
LAERNFVRCEKTSMSVGAMGVLMPIMPITVAVSVKL